MLEKIFAVAGGVSIIDATCTLVGSVIMGRNNLNSPSVVLAGGVLSGFMAGTFISLQQTHCSLDKDSSTAMKLGIAALDIVLLAGAVLLAPLNGERIVNAGTNWTDVTVDSLVGISVIGGGSALILGGVYLAVSKCSPTFFSRQPDAGANPAPSEIANATPPV